MKIIAPVLSLAQLKCKAKRDANYAKLAMVSAKNLGGKPTNLDEALRWLDTVANETGDEDGTVEEINFCRALVGVPPSIGLDKE
jgi:hypothetical protein